jgi:hypothetical protein
VLLVMFVSMPLRRAVFVPMPAVVVCHGSHLTSLAPLPAAGFHNPSSPKAGWSSGRRPSGQ